MTAVDLASAAVFLDFDGTVSELDVGVHLLNRLADDTWLEIEDLYQAGVIGSRQCISRQWALLPTTDEALLNSVAKEVALDPDLERLVGLLRRSGAEVTVVSDGFGFYAAEVCRAIGVPSMTARAEWSTGALSFPYADESCPCAQCGTCKQAPVREAKARGLTTVFVGDGASDRKVAPLADLLYAKDGLAEWCDANEVAYRNFSSLGDVAADLGLVGDR